MRATLAQQRGELLDRWRRQLLAAAESGFALDPATSEVLPALLDAVDRALERRFRPPVPGAPPAAAEGRRAALQASLLCDFLFDAVLETLPALRPAEERLLAQALLHGAVELLVRGATERGERRRRRQKVRLTRLGHELGNAATAARLSFDLLRRRGLLEDSKTARLLDRSLRRLRDAVEEALLDEALAPGALRRSHVRLQPVLAQARAELQGLDRRVTVLLDEPGPGLHVNADPRVVRPAVRGMLRAALELARPGAVIRLGAGAARNQARVAVEVDGCRRLRGGRLPELPAIALARRAAKAHGGSLSARTRGPGCELLLALPRVQRH